MYRQLYRHCLLSLGRHHWYQLQNDYLQVQHFPLQQGHLYLEVRLQAQKVTHHQGDRLNQSRLSQSRLSHSRLNQSRLSQSRLSHSRLKRSRLSQRNLLLLHH
ncbi:pentapeptide repeat-containing protein [Glaciecola sp. MH2013]|uniref:pentapeptide repeat-containing protein n=1 Tax=Glaciecola sp. MH2013 TaxID=2785524 RepID=UPI00351BF20A